MSKSYDSQNITSFTLSCKVGKYWNISLLARLACFVVFLQAAFDSVALQNDGYAGCTPANTADSTEIHFRISSSGLDFGWDTNGVKLEGVKQRINEISAADTSLIISSLRIVGSASPEGSAKYNRLLSEKRANAVYDYLREVVSLPDSITNIEYLGRNWKGLYDLVASDPAVPSHPEVLALLRGVEKSSELSTSESNNLLYQLKRLRGGEPYIYMYHHLFPALRTSYVFVEYENRPDLGLDRVVPEETDGVGSQPADSVVDASEETDSAHCTTTDLDLAASPTLYSDDRPAIQAGKGAGKPFYMDVRTNMLFDILAVPNIGAEFYVGKNISVFANWMYSWWDCDSHHRYWRIYGG